MVFKTYKNPLFKGFLDIFMRTQSTLSCFLFAQKKNEFPLAIHSNFWYLIPYIIFVFKYFDFTFLKNFTVTLNHFFIDKFYALASYIF